MLQGNKDDPFFYERSNTMIADFNQQDLAMNMRSIKKNRKTNKLLIEKNRISNKSFIKGDKSK